MPLYLISLDDGDEGRYVEAESAGVAILVLLEHENRDAMDEDIVDGADVLSVVLCSHSEVIR